MDQEIAILPAGYALIPLAALVALWVVRAFYLRRQRSLESASDAHDGIDRPYKHVVAPLVLSAGLFFMIVWTVFGLSTATPLGAILYSVIMAGCGMLTLLREPVRAALVRRDATCFKPSGDTLRAIRDIVLLAVGSFFAILALEFAWNPSVLSIPLFNLVLEFSLVFGAFAFAYFITQRRCFGPVVVATILGALGIAQYFVVVFRNSAIMPSDFQVLGTAFSVMGSFSYYFNDRAWMGLAFGGLAFLALSFIRPRTIPKGSEKTRDIAKNLVFAIIIGIALVASVKVPNFKWDYGVSIDYWNALKSYRHQGALPGFISAAQDLPLSKPDGYQREEAQALEAEYVAAYDELYPDRAAVEAQFEEVQPNVIIVMNETFCDLSTFEDLRSGYTGPSFYNEWSQTAIATGSVGVSAYGGGTCNTEFETLTGNPIAYLGWGRYPFTQYNLKKTVGMGHLFSELGYYTIGMHPNKAGNWNRKSVYPQLGFDEFLSIDDFAGAGEYHSNVCDEATYDKVLELVAEHDEPVMIFDVTMQNHGGYDHEDIPASDQLSYEPEGYSAEGTDYSTNEVNGWCNEFLACINESDRALEQFIGQLEELDEPVVLVFFGDHQPFFTYLYNDAFFDAEDEEGVFHKERIYQTSYAIWANYDVEAGGYRQLFSDENPAAGTADAVSDGQVYLHGDPTSANYLVAMTMSLIGAPLSDYQKAQLVVREAVPVTNLTGYLGGDGVFYRHDNTEGPYLESSEALWSFECVEFSDWAG